MFERKAKRDLLKAHYYFYEPHLMEFSMIRCLLMGKSTQRNYQVLINQDDAKHLDICIRGANARKKVFIRFYGITDRSHLYVGQLLYDCSERYINYKGYNDGQRIMEVVFDTARMLDCGWEKLAASQATDCKEVYVLTEDGYIYSAEDFEEGF